MLRLAGIREGSFAMKAGTEYLTTLFTIGLLSALLGDFVFRMALKYPKAAGRPYGLPPLSARQPPFWPTAPYSTAIWPRRRNLMR